MLIYAPLGDDARAIAAEVDACGELARICSSAADLAQIMRDGGPEAALLCIVSQEGAGPDTANALAEVFTREPGWARLPILFLVADLDKPPPAVRLLNRRENAPPFLLLVRPCRSAVLRHAVEVQAAARRRQFETRDLLEKLAGEERRSRFLLSELHHRTRNSLSVLRAMFNMSVRSAIDFEDLRKSFGERLENLSVAHARLSGDGAGKASLPDLVTEHVQPYAIAPDQLHMSGTDALLDEGIAFDLALVIHELATNAAKYGALSQPEGRVEVDWVREADAGLLRLTWQERGGPTVSAPKRQGLGSRLIHEYAPTGRRAQVDFNASGLVWTGQIPIDPRDASSV